MATYKEIRGTHILSVTSDPPSPVNGQMWYNSTTKTLKGFTSSPVGSWSTDANMNTGRRYPGGAGTNTAALAFGGLIDPPATNYNNTESYNGTSWTEVNNLNTARYNSDGIGVAYTAALYTGGYTSTNVAVVESWNGSNWTEISDLNVAKSNNGGAGTNTAALVFGGYDGSSVLATTENYNGSSWTEVNDLNTAGYFIEGIGATNTAALAVGGRSAPPPSALAKTESWNGSSWTEVNDLNTARFDDAGTTGDYTNALLIAGYSTTFNANVEVWNGSSWTETTDISAAKADLAGAGTGTAGIAFAGRTAPNNPSTTTEIFSSPTTSTVTFTVS